MSELLTLALTFLKIGAFVFGGGLVMIPFLKTEIVGVHHWLDQRQFVDAIALGQSTPGPFVISAAFVGYKVAVDNQLPGVLGAAVATVCLFLPAFVLVLIISHHLSRFRDRASVRAFLSGVAPAVVGLLLVSAFGIARQEFVNQAAVIYVAKSAIAVGASLAVIRFKVDTVLVVLAAGALGLLLR